MSLWDKPQGVRWPGLCWQNHAALHPAAALSEPGSGLGKHYSEPVRLLPGLGMSSVDSRHLCH